MTDDQSRPDLSVVILCYRNGEETTPFVNQVIDILESNDISSFELVLVANHFFGSSDSTPEIVKGLAQTDPRLIPVTFEKKGMMGWDVISGLNASSGNVVALIDGDGQMPPSDIIRVYKILLSGELDFVKTFRKTRYDGNQRIIVSRVYNTLFHLLFPLTPFRDINSKPKMWSRNALDRLKLNCTGWFSDGEIILEARRLDFSFAEIPTVFFENEWRGSFVSVSTVFEMFFSLFLYRIIYWFKR